MNTRAALGDLEKVTRALRQEYLSPIRDDLRRFLGHHPGGTPGTIGEAYRAAWARRDGEATTSPMSISLAFDGWDAAVAAARSRMEDPLDPYLVTPGVIRALSEVYLYFDQGHSRSTGYEAWRRSPAAPERAYSFPSLMGKFGSWATITQIMRERGFTTASGPLDDEALLAALRMATSLAPPHTRYTTAVHQQVLDSGRVEGLASARTYSERFGGWGNVVTLGGGHQGTEDTSTAARAAERAEGALRLYAAMTNASEIDRTAYEEHRATSLDARLLSAQYIAQVYPGGWAGAVRGAGLSLAENSRSSVRLSTYTDDEIVDWVRQAITEYDTVDGTLRASNYRIWRNRRIAQTGDDVPSLETIKYRIGGWKAVLALALAAEAEGRAHLDALAG